MTPTGTKAPPRIVLLAGKFFFRFRNALFPVLFLLLPLLIKPARFLGHEVLDWVTTALGFGIALAGEGLRATTVGLAYIKRGGRDGKVYAEGLVTTGIYAHSRNPMYVANTLIAGGICLMYGSPWTYAVAFPCFVLAYMSIIAEEERYLRGRFGAEFEAYCERTNSFWLSLRGLPATFAEYDFNWKRAISKEHGTMFSLGLGSYALLLWKYGHLYGWAPLQAHPTLLAIPVVLLTLLYLTVRVLKRRGFM